MDWHIIIAAAIKVVVFVFLITLPLVAMSVWAERRVSAAMQDRVGPNRVGPFGLLQAVADGLKFLLKEDFTPDHVRKGYFWLAPALTMVPALMTCASAGSQARISQASMTVELINHNIHTPTPANGSANKLVKILPFIGL